MTKTQMTEEILSIRRRAGLLTHSSYRGQLMATRKADLEDTLLRYRANADKRELVVCFHVNHCGATALEPCSARPRRQPKATGSSAMLSAR